MADWIGEAKALVLPYREMLGRLAIDFIHGRGVALRSELDRHKSTNAQVWFALLAISLVAGVVGLYVNPLTRPAGDIPTTLRQLALSGPVLLLPGILPMYLATRLISGSRCFWFLLIVNQIAAAFTCVAIYLTTIPGVYLSTQLVGDIEEVRDGRGQDTPFYHLWCAPIDQNALILSEQAELNSLTGKYDLLEELRRLPPSSATGLSEIKRYDGRLSKLTVGNKKRASQLTADIRNRMDAQAEDRDPTKDMAFERYWPMFVGYLASVLANVTFIIWSWILMYRGVIGASASKQVRRRGAVGVLVGATSSIAIAFLFMSMSEGWQFNTNYYDLKSRTLNVETSARAVQSVCGRIDSRGLW